MDVLQILIFLGFICLGFYQTMRKKQPKSARRKVVRKFVPADFFPMEEAIPEEVRMAPPPETRKKKRSVKQEKTTGERTKTGFFADREAGRRPFGICFPYAFGCAAGFYLF